jgi:ABC-type uncharacterized transport system substrate-binding protein
MNYRFVIFLTAIGALAPVAPAQAHPHVFVDARAEIVFGDAGKITGIRHIWQFDEAFSAFAVQGLDTDNDGKLTDAELAPLAKVNVESLQEYDFFTVLKVGSKREVLVPPKEYWLDFHGGRLTLFYTLPLSKPAVMAASASLEVFDPEYFVAFTFAGDAPVALDGAPQGCTASLRKPRELDAATMAAMQAVPKDGNLSPELMDAASSLASMVNVACP